eukprot:CAMPEP_0196764874 /NCGR_PEP_ID=MMETSP1095-20130614/7056_1 /TAXON_ID=96789 ORGANISM="Chromulina nebulosa, Strain UTEXLB2642" /NCGR_SAMPLE_ID=MMETSP1095 /ASSEMBLY_ACC=CAM_ASM_000446 /LENGTH=37 /DNA_ID= /DNA_START= /DNA_END= /DNA_ORIENTATION=
MEPPEVAIDLEQLQRHDLELQQASMLPLPEGDDDDDL